MSVETRRHGVPNVTVVVSMVPAPRHRGPQGSQACGMRHTTVTTQAYRGDTRAVRPRIVPANGSGSSISSTGAPTHSSDGHGGDGFPSTNDGGLAAGCVLAGASPNGWYSTGSATWAPVVCAHRGSAIASCAHKLRA
jgi:hypothetical protein